MEINDAIKNEKSINSFIETYFEPVTPFYKNPLFPLKINHKSKGRTITFCNITPVDSWALKLDSSFTFFLLIKDSVKVFNAITKNYGGHSIESEAAVNDVSMGITYDWENPPIQISLKQFINDEDFPEYEDCYLIRIGNMNFKDIVILPDTTGLDLDDL